MSTNTKADYTVMLVFAVSPENKIFIIEIFREKVSPTKHLDLIKNYFEKYKPNLIGIEKVQYQTALIEEALQHGLPIEELIPRGEKWIRALPIAARMKSGNIYFKSNADWLDEFESELINFPSGDHDDQADAFSYITQIIELSVSQGKLSSAGKKNSISEGYL
jgi:predicted phage terminase large subunit-like protein